MAINNFNVGVGTTSQLTRYRYVATGGETSISGADADGKTLSYTVGLEQVYLNGVNLVRGQDYTATNGTSVGNLTALVASDVVEVFAFVPFNIANAVTASTVDAKGDLLVGTGADAVGRLAVGTNNQLLAADSSTASGLKWVNPGLTLLTTTTFSGATTVTETSFLSSTYDTYRVIVNSYCTTAGAELRFRFRNSSGNITTGYYGAGFYTAYLGTSGVVFAKNNGAEAVLKDDSSVSGHESICAFDLGNYSGGVSHQISGQSNSTQGGWNSHFGYYEVGGGTQLTGFQIYPSAGNITGSLKIYGYNK